MRIETLDVQFQGVPQAIAVYLVVGPGGPVLVETGPASSLDNLLAELQNHGFAPGDIRDVLVTHIHLDHAGAAGWWAQQGSTVHVHHVGAPHLIDPSRLLASATRIYGEDNMLRLWGEILPSPAGRIHALKDGDVVEAGGLQFEALDTPGHAGHHHVFRLGDVAFSGDAAGLRLPGAHLVDLPAPPPEFNRELWLDSLRRLRQEQFTSLYPTHFGRVDDVAGQLDGLSTLLEEATDFVGRELEQGHGRDEIVESYLAWNRERARRHGVPEGLMRSYDVANPQFMSVDGMLRYWRKRREG